jgi:hypothetical protein
MNDNLPAGFIPDLMRHLRAFATLCEDALALACREHQALAAPNGYQPFEFYHMRKNLLNRLDSLMIAIRNARRLWQQAGSLERDRHSEAKAAIQMVQDLILKILQLDRENQQSLLRRGLVPAGHLTSFAPPPPDNYVSNLYRRYSTH